MMLVFAALVGLTLITIQGMYRQKPCMVRPMMPGMPLVFLATKPDSDLIQCCFHA